MLIIGIMQLVRALRDIKRQVAGPQHTLPAILGDPALPLQLETQLAKLSSRRRDVPLAAFHRVRWRMKIKKTDLTRTNPTPMGLKIPRRWGCDQQ